MKFPNKPVTKLIIPLAGLGTRFLPTSTAYPKEMTYLVDKPVLQYLVEEAYSSGIKEIIFIINNQKNIISKYFSIDHHNSYIKRAFPNKKNIPEEYLRLQNLLKKIKFHYIKINKSLGDGHSILSAKSFINPNEPFAVSMGDLLGFNKTPFLKQLMKIYNKENTSVISVEKASLEATSRFGVIAIRKSKGRLHFVKSIIEKPGPKLAPSRLILTGKYILIPAIFNYLESMVKNYNNVEIKLADALGAYSKGNTLLAYECIGQIQDTGNNLDFLKSTITLSLNHQTMGKLLKKFVKSLNI